MDTIYINNSGEYGETVVFAESDRAGLYADLNEAFSHEFNSQDFERGCWAIHLPDAMNESEDKRDDNWLFLLNEWANSCGSFMAGAAAIFEPAYARWQALAAVMTSGEVSTEYDVADATVRQTILRGGIPARKSGGTWLILRSDAETRWGDRK